MSHASYTVRLIECRDNAIVGGKAANLGRLVRAGFFVHALAISYSYLL